MATQPLALLGKIRRCLCPHCQSWQSATTRRSSSALLYLYDTGVYQFSQNARDVAIYALDFYKSNCLPLADMADPVSLTASIVAITQAVSQVYTLGKTIKNAKSEIKRLCEELLALKVCYRNGTNAGHGGYSSGASYTHPDKTLVDDLPRAFQSQEFKDILESRKQFVDDILNGLSKGKGFEICSLETHLAFHQRRNERARCAP